jgi:hypothetical protein
MKRTQIGGVRIVAAAALWTLVACQAGSSSGEPPPGADASPPADADPPRPDAPPDPRNQQACGTFQTGAVVPVAGVDPFNMDAPPIAADARVYRVAIPPRAAGHVTFNAAAAGEYLFFTSAPVALTVFAIDGQLVDIKSLKLKIPECAEVNGRHAVDLEAARYVVRLGPDKLTGVDVVVVPAAP